MNHSIKKDASPFFGMGVLQGMYVTLKNFVASYFCKPENGGIFTVQYPEERCDVFENFRNLPFLVYDGNPDEIRCTACGICERECPVKCIHIEKATDTAGKYARKPAVFDIDYSLCMSCGTCEDVCPFDSIYMDHAFEVSTMESRQDLIKHKEDLLKSNEYFQQIRPRLAALIHQKRHITEEKKKTAAQSRPPQGPAA